MSAGFGFVTGFGAPPSAHPDQLRGSRPGQDFEVFQEYLRHDPDHLTTVWRFTQNAHVDTVWTAVARHIRQYLHAHPDLELPQLIMRANEDDSTANPRGWSIYRNHIDTLTGEALGTFFAGMVTSDATLTLPGVRIELVDLAASFERDPSFDQIGAGRKRRGTAILPVDLKKVGISCHPLEFSNPDASSRHCGPRAFLNAVIPLDAEHIDNYYDAAEQLASQIGIESGWLELHQFQKIVDLPEYALWRIVVWVAPGHQAFQFKGADWRWNPELPRTEPDPLTASIYLDHHNHYWTISHPKSFYSKVNKSHHPGHGRCHICCVDFTPANPHHCSPDSLVQQCEVCLRLFVDPDAFIAHQDEVNSHYDPCESCGRNTFYGPSCQVAHRRTNCIPRKAPRRTDPAQKLFCETCNHAFSSHYPHDCADIKLPCKTCKRIFNTMDEMRAHRCHLQPNTRFWEPTTMQKQRVLWRPHYAYDFETFRNNERSPEVYELSVLSWSVQLMIPDHHHQDLIHRTAVLPTLEERFVDSAAMLATLTPNGPVPFLTHVDPDADCPHPSLRFSGVGIDTFAYLCEHILAREDEDALWTPTLWAHNGSKFDVKFIFHYYVNQRQYDMTAVQYRRTYNDLPVPTQRVDADGAKVWVRFNHKPPMSRLVQITHIGSKILKLSIDSLHLSFKCSHAHHTCPLRALPTTFGLKSQVRKGEFPYGWLLPSNWGVVHPDGLPPLSDYQIDTQTPDRRLAITSWWIAEQTRRNVNPATLHEQCRAADLQLPIPADSYRPDQPPEPWHYDDEMWGYLASDVHVLARAMEAYHRSAHLMHEAIWSRLPPDDARRDRMVSPLDCGTTPGWAFRMFATWFMPAETIHTLTLAEHEFVSASLRGGRTDKRAHYAEVTPERRAEGDSITYLDVKSLYPSVMQCDIHNTHFPVGEPRWLKQVWPESSPDHHWWHRICGDRTSNDTLRSHMQERTGFLEVDVRIRTYTTHPVLHHIPQPSSNTNAFEPPRLLFANQPLTKVTYAWPELEEAMRNDEVVVCKVHSGLIFDRGHTLFNDYVRFFFDLKDKAEHDDNAGLRALAKLLLNSLWGKLGQRSYPIKEWVTSRARFDYLEYLLFTGAITDQQCYRVDGLRLHYEYRLAQDTRNVDTTAPHLAAFVSMWGRVILQQKVLRLHGQRVLYTDTDSAIIYVRRADTELARRYQGNAIGDLTDELPKIIKSAGYSPKDFPHPYISELVAIAPKTYSFVISHDGSDMRITKAVCKGFTPSYNNQNAVCHDRFKELIWAQLHLRDFHSTKRPLTEIEQQFNPHKKVIRTFRHKQFISNITKNLPLPAERDIDRTMSCLYTKGATHPSDPRLVIPFGDLAPRSGHDDHFLTFLHPDKQYI